MQIKLDFCDPRAPLAPVPVGSTLQGATAVSSGALRCAFDTPLHTLVAHTPEQVKPLLTAVEAFAKQGLWCVGYLRYEAARAFDAAFVTHEADGPLAWFSVFEQALPWPAQGTQARAVEAASAAPLLDGMPAQCAAPETRVTWRSPLTRPEFDANMSRIHQAIAAGEFYQVNYTAPLRGTFAGDAASLFTRLQRAQPGGYAAFIDTGLEQILSVSPELFFDWQDGQMLTRPMKGTAPRGSNAEEDASLAQGLQTSPKERAENVMIVDLLRNDLSRIALPHSVKVPQLFTIQSLPTVLQMVSDVTAQTRPGTTLAEVFGALFPCGSITGAPKVRAMQMVGELEPAPRGIYCGAIGVVRPGGHATFNVAIRTVTLRGADATCGIGSGITADATADAEWQEWQHKRGFLARASEAFNLLETLRLEGGAFQHLEAHLARLQTAAAHFAYPFDEARIRQALHALAGQGGGTWRVRLQLDEHGTPQVEKFAIAQPNPCSSPPSHSPLPGLPTGMRPEQVQKFISNEPLAPVLLALAATYFIASHSEFTRFKTTRRAHYEAFAPTDPAVFDTLLCNAQGELTECTRGNIALLLDGQWVTPALQCGLLNGIGRAHWLQQGRIKESVITLADLPRVQALAFINSLRGWVDARFT